LRYWTKSKQSLVSSEFSVIASTPKTKWAGALEVWAKAWASSEQQSKSESRARTEGFAALERRIFALI
jgi:hypothetical protein